jgi:uncharacterized protein (DUF983 family)
MPAPSKTPYDSTIAALLALRCPRCHRGPLFKHSAASWHFAEMYDACVVCEQTYEPEPGFYYGAMYLNTGFAIMIFGIVGVVLYNFFGDPDTWVYILTVFVLALVTTPLVFRYSRALMLYLFGGVRYDPRRAQAQG